MAAAFANFIRARRLVLTHRSNRYEHVSQGMRSCQEPGEEVEGDAYDRSSWLQQAKDVFAYDRITLATDLLHIPIPSRGFEGEKARHVSTAGDRPEILEGIEEASM